MRGNLSLEINWQAWEIPPIFRIIQEIGAVPDEEMRSAFNMGLGLVVIAPPSSGDSIQKTAQTHGYNAFEIGTIKG